MSWISIVLTVLRLAEFLANYFREQKLIKQGEDAAIARAAAKVLARTEQGRKLRDKIDTLPDTEEKALWDQMLKEDKK